MLPDPGIVSTDIITMHKWFDPLTDIFFRPFIRKPKKGASTAIGLLLDEKEAGVTGQLYVNNHRKNLSDKYTNHVQKEQLWGGNGTCVGELAEVGFLFFFYLNYPVFTYI